MWLPPTFDARLGHTNDRGQAHNTTNPAYAIFGITEEQTRSERIGVCVEAPSLLPSNPDGSIVGKDTTSISTKPNLADITKR
ncbi:hypothetical protein M408DRAFT_25097 [Serendipita vermifera MAFF 305830]|uniref:Uncharacterized protein n=1 Tax=Serendipita vermifera MAFF 305830 TaxID=933852 RepID=A0A0C3AQH6_SERVB|nr:hypothetical protein M408DRAFT_25097 [Serendipita vermifera MAFF 305830]